MNPCTKYMETLPIELIVEIIEYLDDYSAVQFSSITSEMRKRITIRLKRHYDGGINIPKRFLRALDDPQLHRIPYLENIEFSKYGPYMPCTDVKILNIDFINRGIQDIKEFSEWLRSRYPNVQVLCLINHIVYSTQCALELGYKNLDYTYDDLCKDHNLKSIYVEINTDGSDARQLGDITSESTVIFITNNMQFYYNSGKNEHLHPVIKQYLDNWRQDQQ